MHIPAGSRLEGTLDAASDVRLDGVLHGKLSCRGTLMVSAGSHVGAEIHAKSAHLAGRVTGDVEAEDLVVLTSSAVLEGSLRAGRVVVVEGAAITGTISVRPRRN